MSIQAMILTAAIVVPGEGKGNVSGEMVRGLDLSGQWEGTLRSKQGEVSRVRIDRKVMLIESKGITRGFSTSRLIDEGGGKLLYRGQLSLYRQGNNLLVICVGDLNRRPSSIGEENGNLFILHRVKSRK
jgi:hypothetical protein